MSSPSDLDRDVTRIARIDAVSLILSMVKHTTGMRFAAVARVTDSRWVACAVDDSIDFGLEPGGELVLETTICNEIRDHRRPMIFRHASEDSVYSVHHTPRLYQLESYVSIPIITADGEFFGTLCAIDTAPAQFDEMAVLNTLGLYAQLIGLQLDMQQAQETTQVALINEEETGRLREQFIAVLGHDLRSPLTAIGMSSELLEAKLTGERERELASGIKQSSRRMSSLIEDVLDFSNGRLGDGIPVKREVTRDLLAVLNSVVDEITVSHPEVSINSHFSIESQSFCDAGRMGQLLSNLLINAVTHGSPDSPVDVTAKTENGEIALSVTNSGPVIPQELMSLLFQPFTRSNAGGRGKGLGLGLYIASQIAAAHDGTLSVSSTPENGTRFVARLPNVVERVALQPIGKPA
ncbi:GAF domain-containing sensor histidine kinase [Pseudomonas sp. OIL-1]|uniref:GAF domain-containing sensor histidine kinase n=1 Tax=Pseudomonas sp. OIL-1 TaxID=2706126 RepID=UPI0013A72B0F|nr:GAF domain-containing sensor histidine kinase [Pseudomonas sp. OIL-1]QIB51776.1 GAF domain-containing sensor histidine kinase [Pseudomonas sp. OIL-1]